MISLRAQNIKVERSLTIINVIQVRMRVVRVIDDHRTTETVAILGRQMTVVPERARLIRDGEVVEERVPRSDRALVHECGSVRPVRALLIDAVPVLHKTIYHRKISEGRAHTHHSSGLEHRLVGELIHDVELEVIALL